MTTPRTEKITIRLTPNEKAQLLNTVYAEQETISTFIRNKVLIS